VLEGLFLAAARTHIFLHTVEPSWCTVARFEGKTMSRYCCMHGQYG
jgi:hypothetical protein